MRIITASKKHLLMSKGELSRGNDYDCKPCQTYIHKYIQRFKPRNMMPDILSHQNSAAKEE